MNPRATIPNPARPYSPIGGHMGVCHSPPKAFRGVVAPPPLSRKSDTLPGKIVIEKRIKTEFTRLLGHFGENTVHPTQKCRFPPGSFTPPSGADRAHVCSPMATNQHTISHKGKPVFAPEHFVLYSFICWKSFFSISVFPFVFFSLYHPSIVSNR